jgi:hypothetical protein
MGSATAISETAWRNLWLLGSVLLLFGIWCYVFTDWLSPLALVFSGTGFLAGMYALLQLLPKSWSEQIQEEIKNRLFEAPAMTWLYIGLLAVEVLLYLCAIGYLGIEVMPAAAGREFRLLEWDDGARGASDYSTMVEAEGPTALVPGTPVRSPYLKWPWRPRQLLLKVNGFPDAVIDVRNYRPRKIYVPGELWRRPVVLLLPKPGLINLRNKNVDVIAQVKGPSGESRQLPRVPFEGHAVWIGCDDDVEVPRELVESWQRELSYRKADWDLEYWLRPVALKGPRFELVPGDEIELEIKNRNSQEALIEKKVIRVRQHTFPQVEKCDVKNQ